MLASIKWIGSPNQKVGRRGFVPVAIVIHIMEGTLSGTDSWFLSTKSQVSAHYGIGKSGEIHQYVKEENTAFHAGRVHSPIWTGMKVNGPGTYINPNYYTIGIEHEGQPNSEWTDAMYKTSSELIRDICTRRNIPITRQHIIGHHEIYSLKTCPGSKVDLDKLIRMASENAPVEELNKIIQTGTVTVNAAGVNLRSGHPSMLSPAKAVTAGSKLIYAGWVTNGQSIDGNSRWFFDENQNYFWSGAVMDLGMDA